MPHAFDDLCARGIKQLNRNVGVLELELSEQLRKYIRAVRSIARHHDLGKTTRADLREIALQRLRRSQSLARVLVQSPAALGGDEPSPLPREDRCAQFLPQQPQLRAQRRLRQVQFFGRAAHTAVLDH